MELTKYIRTPEGEIYLPNELQQPLHDSNAMFIWNHSGVGGGKTIGGQIEYLKWGFENPGGLFFLGRPNMSLFRANTWKSFIDIIRYSFPELIVGDVIDNQVMCQVQLDTGGKLPTTFIGRPLVDVESLEGLNLSGFFIDEICQLEDDRILKELWRRCRNPIGPNRGICIGTPNGFDWAHKFFTTGKEKLFFHFGGYSGLNKALKPGWVRKQEESGLYTHEEIRRRFYGEFVVGQGLVYPQFKRDLHVIDRLPAEWRSWKKYRAIDPGTGRDGAAVCLFIAMDTYGRSFVYDCMHVNQMELPDQCRIILEKSGNDKFEWTVIDTASNTTGGGSLFTVKRQYEQKLGITTFNGTKDAEGSQLLLRQALLPNEGIPHPKNPENLLSPAFYILDSPANAPLIHEFTHHVYDPRTGKPEKKNDHGLDCCRYYLAADPRPTAFEDNRVMHPTWAEFYERNSPKSRYRNSSNYAVRETGTISSAKRRKTIWAPTIEAREV